LSSELELVVADDDDDECRHERLRSELSVLLVVTELRARLRL